MRRNEDAYIFKRFEIATSYRGITLQSCRMQYASYSRRSQIRCLTITVTGFCLRTWHHEGSRKWKL